MSVEIILIHRIVGSGMSIYTRPRERMKYVLNYWKEITLGSKQTKIHKVDYYTLGSKDTKIHKVDYYTPQVLAPAPSHSNSPPPGRCQIHIN